MHFARLGHLMLYFEQRPSCSYGHCLLRLRAAKRQQTRSP
jgi:hypothetical protein